MRVEKLNEDLIEKNISVNIKSPLLITSFLLLNFKNNKLVFVNISSGASVKPIANWSLYCSSKAFMKVFFKVTEKENNFHKFYNIDPGVINTRMQKIIRKSNFPDVKKFKNLHVSGNLKSADDVALEIYNIIK